MNHPLLIAGLLLPKELISILVRQDDTILEQFEIGKGGFGTVVSGIFEPANGLCLKVAVKTANKGREDILKNEAIIMSQLDHPNIVKILGFQKKPMKLVMEYLECKNLAEFLSENKVPQRCLYDMILDILTGMEFMSKKKFIHRDLTARNIFINSLFRCKIGDFGLSCYVGDTNGVFIEEDGKRICGYVVPPESQITGQFTTKSDIWAMAIVIWEMFYMHHSCYEVCLAHLSKLVFFGAFSLPPPPNCPSVLYNYIMEDLMNENPELRPDFSDIIRVLTRFISLD